MSRQQVTRPQPISSASLEEVKRVIGDIDQPKLLDIMALGPTVRDLENAVMALSGDRDIFGPGEPLAGVAAEVVAILGADDEQDPQRLPSRGA